METLSSLYRRYNGFMLGLVFSANTLLTDKERYLVHRRRMKELFEEIGVDVFLPEIHVEFADVGVELVTHIGEALHERDRQLYDYWFLGQSACGLAHTQDADPQMLGKVNAQFEDAARSCGVARTEYLRYQGAVSKLADQPLSWSQVLNPGYGLATSLISSVKPEDDTCFVVMPFSEEFARRYELFYRPALNSHGYRTIRAWDGFGGEAYLDLLRVLIERCGSVFADLSEDPGVGLTNPN
ncbi:MAG: hypothetical protein OEQ18_15780, partial [Gammaproteobacteria bacterium]|nr:hypothetical protein [Gammaproteobacteria bacterium]